MTATAVTVLRAATLTIALLAACGDDDDDDRFSDELSAQQEADFETESEFAECMRAHGIEGYPDPQLSESGFLLAAVPWAADAEEWNTVAHDCATNGDERAAAGWEQIVPGGDCECADGSEFAFFERRADPTKVVFFLDGGGTCFDATTCAFLPESYDWEINDNPAEEDGIFDLARADNPFRDYSFLYVPTCTGDVHLGDTTREYSPELTVEHNGFVNGTAALSYLTEHYPDAAQVVVVGKSSGSIAAPVYGGMVADRLPDARVTVFGANSGAYPDDPDLTATLIELWGVHENMPDWEVNEGLTASDWTPTRFWVQAGLHDPHLALARFDYAFDAEVVPELEALGVDATSLEVIDANEATIETAGVVQHSYTAPGDGHRILEWPTFYELGVNGVSLVDWVEALIAGRPLDDVHCDDCESR
jgi:Pectinacetylesterase